MPGKTFPWRDRTRLAVHGLVMGLGLALVGSSWGCDDHRMDYREFLAEQEEHEQEAAAAVTSRPTSEKEKARAIIEKALGPYRVGSGDVLVVTLTQLDQAAPFAPLQIRVSRDGELKLPVVGPVSVAGQEVEDVESKIHDAYVPAVYKDVAVHVQVLEGDTANVIVVGAATMPGMIHLKRTQRNLLYAVVEAGGLTEVASGIVTLQRIRNPEDKEAFDLRQPDGLTQALALEPLQNGDIVRVEAATPNTIYVGGLVKAPHPQPYPSGTQVTILQALAASGGLRTDVTPHEATLIRRMADGQDIHVKINLDRVTTGKDPNITLAAGDILWVPDTLETMAEDWLNRNFYIRGGFVANVNYNVSGLEYLNRRGQQTGGGRGGNSLQDLFDPFGFITRGNTLNALLPP